LECSQASKISGAFRWSNSKFQIPNSKFGGAVLLVAVLVLLSRSALPAAVPPWPVTLVDVADRAGLREPSVYGDVDRKRFIIETNGAGVAFLDYDNDGWVDALVLNGTRLRPGTREAETYAPGKAPLSRLYRNNHDGTFSDVTSRAGLMNRGEGARGGNNVGWASSVCAGDYDNDGWLDIFITYYGQNVLYRNRGDGRFEDVTARAGLPTGGTRWGSGCTFVDYDRDGRVDLFVANYLRFDLAAAPDIGNGPNCLWKGVPVNCGPRGLPFDTNLLFHNEGNGTFADVSTKSGIARVSGRYAMTAAAADFDGDGWIDIYVAGDSTASILYHNNHDGTFTDTAVESGVAYSENGTQQAGMGVAVGDYNADGWLDIFKTHFADDIPALYRNVGKGIFEDVASAAGLGVLNRYVEWAAGMPDLDNDGRPDLVYVTGNVYPEVERVLERYPHRGPRVVFRNVDGVRFEEATAASGPGASTPHSSRGAAFGDFDNDGDVDILVFNMNEPPSLLRNDYHGANRWLEVKLEGTASNRAALGATVRVKAGGRIQAQAVLSQSSYFSHDDLRLHFGLGPSEAAETVEVRWPSGRVDVLNNVRGGRVVSIKEGGGQAR
jgi:enediyne biosynthesis protein E4